MKLLEYRLRPKSDYLISASWEKVYSLTETWKQNLLFHENEIRFIDTIFSIKECLPEQHNETMKDALHDLSTQVITLLAQTDEHLSHLERMTKNPGKETDHSADLLFREENNVLEDNIAAFEQTLRQTKEKLFTLTAQRVGATTG